MAAAGAQNGRFGLATARDRWAAPFAWRWATARGLDPSDIAQPAGCPSADLAADDPIAAIMASPDFPEFSAFFNVPSAEEPALVSAYTQGLLYALVRHLRPEHVVEIGSYRLSTSRVICRALHANGRGMLHTVDPNNCDGIVALLRRWPQPLRDRLCYYPVSSMEFFAFAPKLALQSELVFVDGNHDYEYALFDILSAERLVTPGGFIAIDNISQGGPLYAARNFMRERPGWRECGSSLETSPLGKAFDRDRSTILGTDLCVLRAPTRYFVGPRLETSGAQWIDKEKIGGLELSIASRASGTLHAQYVVRVVKPQSSETTTEASVEFRDAVGPTRVELPWRFAADEMPLMRWVELWLGWVGEKDLELSGRPIFY
ncbi:MAG: class I SAM-dependent methyltransferase [Stellaceae bacterium]